MTLRERAERLFQLAKDGKREYAVEQIESFALAIRREALEEAANIADEELGRNADNREDAGDPHGNFLWAAYDGGVDAARSILEDIRALAAKEDGK